jgi:cellulose synthase/poly-beta-1,6-N-acetylglucosamine synthase-like glycosyltransferase
VPARTPAAGEPPSPRVSVLLPAFDAAATLATALSSVARQTEPDLECIVVDDGSSDSTLEIARAHAARDARFRVHGIAHAGIVPALEHGLALCRGLYVARMDADDWMHRDRLRLQVEELERRPELAAVGCHVRIFPRRGLRDGFRDLERWLASIATPEDVRRNAFVDCPVVHPSLVFRTDVLRRFGYRDIAWPEDYDLVLRLLAEGRDVAVLPRRLLGWRDSPLRLTRTDPRCSLERIADAKAAFLAAGLLAGTDEYILWGYGSTGRAIRRALLAHGKRPSHVVEVHPRRLGETIQGAPVIDPDRISQVPRRPLIASVAGAEPRGLIRAHLDALGWRETRDYLCLA